jgi:metallophosphoesterase superfamily enzyme
MPEEWRIELHDHPIAEPPFLYAHEPPEEVTDLYVWSGHIHPMMRLRGRHDSLRLPCFAISQSHSVLPAFSEFTGGIDLRLNDWKKVFVIADNAVIEV